MPEQNISLNHKTAANALALAVPARPHSGRSHQFVLRLCMSRPMSAVWPAWRQWQHQTTPYLIRFCRGSFIGCYIGCCIGFASNGALADTKMSVADLTPERQTSSPVSAALNTTQPVTPAFEWTLAQTTRTTPPQPTASRPVSRLTRQLQEEPKQQGYTFTYQWDALPPLRFTLSPGPTEQRIAARRRYSVDMLNARLRQYLLQQQSSLQQAGIRLELSPPAQPLSYQLSGIDAAKVRSAQTSLHKALDDQRTAYLTENYFYQLPPTQGQRWIVVDHVRIMQESLPLLQPVAAALSAQLGQQNIRQISSHVLRFIQQIPYNDLSNRRDSQGSAFAPPWQLLQEHRGDCDSKAVLLAGILRQLFPRLQIAILYLSDHAVLAAQIPPLPGETKVELNGQSLLILDATGPALLPPGKTGDKYQQQLQNRQFSYRFFPVNSQ